MGPATRPTPANTRNTSQPSTDWMAMMYTGSDTRSFQLLERKVVENAEHCGAGSRSRTRSGRTGVYAVLF